MLFLRFDEESNVILRFDKEPNVIFNAELLLQRIIDFNIVKV